MQNKTTITICGREFKIVSDDSGEYIHQLAYELNERIKETSAAYIGLPTSPATALTALQILDELTEKNTIVGTGNRGAAGSKGKAQTNGDRAENPGRKGRDWAECQIEAGFGTDQEHGSRKRQWQE